MRCASWRMIQLLRWSTVALENNVSSAGAFRPAGSTYRRSRAHPIQAQAEQYPHDCGAERQAPPEAGRAIAERERQDPAAEESEAPVADAGEHHGYRGVLVAAQRARRDSLQAVKHLEQRGDRE